MASDLAENDGGDELIAAEIHTALHEIGKVVGAVSTDDILDRVFSSFCIGK
jgi:tRNA modification GTPase